ncbi:MAG TPA: hypothetical protein VF509_15940 [Sphingobium sp.]
MTTAGRPVRAFVLLLLGWTISRIVISASTSLVPPSAPASERRLYQRLTFDIPTSVRAPIMSPATIFDTKSAGFAAMATRRLSVAIPPSVEDSPAEEKDRSINSMDNSYAYSVAVPDPLPAPTSQAQPFLPAAKGSSRWSMDAWTLVRNGGSQSSLASYGQLGASQAGMRLQYDLTPHQPSRIALYSRVSSALDSPHAPEASVGLAYRPARSLPFDVAIERRFSLGDGARNAFAVIGITGFGPAQMPLGLQGEGYAQAGFVGLKRKDAFADGKLSVSKAIAGDNIAIGLTTSGGAQRNLTRLDIGPHVQMRLSAGKIQSRLAAEWRQRITGRAQPGSGPAITLAAGF